MITDRDIFPLETPSCWGKTSLMLGGFVLLLWRWLR